MTCGGLRRSARVMLLLAVALTAGGAAPAFAEQQPSILQAYDLDWIERVPESAWPGVKEQRPVICLLDTGVAITPDTPEDDPRGPIVARLAVDGGSGLPQGDEPLHAHGTLMAQVMAAPRNGWGTVGVFPQARIVSVRVTHKQETHIAPAEMVLGVRACLDWAWSHGTRIASVVMAESNYAQRAVDAETWLRAAEAATGRGAAFMAAAGNADGALPPMGITDVVTVGASGDTGSRCRFVPEAQGPVIWAPGCGFSGWPHGSSTSTAVVGAAVAAVATRSPELSGVEALRFVGVQTRRLDGRLMLLGPFSGVVPEMPTVTTQPSLPESPQAIVPETRVEREPAQRDPRVTRLWRPKVSLSWRRGRLRVKVAGGVPRRGRVRIEIGRQLARGPRGRKAFSLRWKRRPVSAMVWVEGEWPVPWRSTVRKAKVRRG